MDAIGVFRRAAAREPARAFAFDAKASVTYAEAEVRSDAVASALRARGVAEGEPLGLCAPDCVDLLLAILGAWKAGALPALIDPRTSEADLPYFLGDIRPRLAVTTADLRGRFAASGMEIVDFATVMANGGVGPARHGPSAPLYLSYTSGTTGRPKGALLVSAPVTLGTACITERLGLTRGDTILATTPTSSSFQLVAAFLPAIHVGATIGLAAGVPAEELWDLVEARRATVLVAYPLTLADVVNAARAHRHSSLRLALSGGSPLAPRIKRDYRERLGIPLLESYGQSEFGGFMALGSPYDDERTTADGFVGRSLPDRPAYVADADGREVPTGRVGEVTVPDGFFAGYWNNAAATAKTLAGGILHSGDLGVADGDGYLKVLGRVREAEAARRRGGFLREVEDACYEHPDVQHAVVVETAEGEIGAFVELRQGCTVAAEDLTDFAAALVVPGPRLGSTTILPRMPRTFSGKPDRRRLAGEVARR